MIDGRVGFTGGYNLANEYFNVTHPYGMWKDTGIRIEGDAVRSLTVSFLEMWNAMSRTVSEEPEQENTCRRSPAKQSRTDLSSPMRIFLLTGNRWARKFTSVS